jgi:hypothetical protein
MGLQSTNLRFTGCNCPVDGRCSCALLDRRDEVTEPSLGQLALRAVSSRSAGRRSFNELSAIASWVVM